MAASNEGQLKNLKILIFGEKDLQVEDQPDTQVCGSQDFISPPGRILRIHIFNKFASEVHTGAARQREVYFANRFTRKFWGSGDNMSVTSKDNLKTKQACI